MKRNDAYAAAVLAGKPLPLPVIDIHGHIGPYAGFYIPNPDASGLIRVMDRCGVAALAVSAHYSMNADYRYGNDLTAAAMKEYPGRILGYALANPYYDAATEDDLTRCFDEQGFRMIKLHPGVHRVALTDKRYEAAYKFAEKRGAPILTHTWEDDVVCKPDVAAEAARRHPSVTFIWGHGGAPLFDKALEYAVELPNVYLDLACSRVFNGQMEHFLSKAPVEKILFASDCPFLSMTQQIGRVAFSDISEGDKRKLLRDNALGLLKAAGVSVISGLEKQG